MSVGDEAYLLTLAGLLRDGILADPAPLPPYAKADVARWPRIEAPTTRKFR